MPIQFRCRECKQVLSVSSKRAGGEISCPACKARVTVPTVEEVQAALERTAAQKKRQTTPKEAAEFGDEVRAEPTALQPQPALAAAGGAADPESWGSALTDPDPWAEGYEEEKPFKLEREPLPESGMDMTPMVDVTFLLLIFFMITASFSLQRSLPATAPEPEDEGAASQMTLQEVEEESVVVFIDNNDVMYVDDVAVGGLGELNDILAARASEGKTDMLIEIEYGAKHGTMVAVQDAGYSAGMQGIRVSSRSQDE